MTKHGSAALLLSLIIGIWAVPLGTAHSSARVPRSSSTLSESGRGITSPSIPRTVNFRELRGRGLLVRAWVNSAGPYSFALDTGAGATLLSARVASEAHVNIKSGRTTSIGGLSGATVSASEATLRSLALGDRENYLPAKGLVMVTGALPGDLDGVLDPTEAFAPLGYAIDLPRGELSAFDPQDAPVRSSDQPPEGTVVQWLREGRGHRPFVQLDNGDRALLDTGSNLGLAIRDREPGSRTVSVYAVRDVGGGRVSARRAGPTTITIGSLELRNIPTDLISGAEAGAPVLLGLNALRPFKLRFDPTHHLIEIAPGAIRAYPR
jgi:predicted aspartyl protease